MFIKIGDLKGEAQDHRLYSGLQLYQLNSPNVISVPNQNLPCGFPFEGSTTVQGILKDALAKHKAKAVPSNEHLAQTAKAA